MRKVLIADDEPKVCQLIFGLVPWASLGLTVVGMANDGIAALEAVRRERPDILVTDIRMPGLDGIELIRRAKEAQPALRCVIVSGYRHFDYAHNAIKFGVEDYLLKPLQKQELIDTLKKLIAMKPEKTDEDEGPRLAELVRDCMEARLQEADSAAPLLFDRYGLTLPRGGVLRALVAKADLPGVSARDGVARIATEKIAASCTGALSPLAEKLYTAVLPLGAVSLVSLSDDCPDVFSATLEALRDRAELMRDLFPALRVSIGVSEAGTDAASVKTLIVHAMGAADRRLFANEGAVYFHRANAPVPQLLRLLPADLVKRLSAETQALCPSGYGPLLREGVERLRMACAENPPALHTLLREWIRLHFEALPQKAPLADMEAAIAACDDIWDSSLRVADVCQGFAALLTDHLARLREDRSQVEQLPLRRAKAYIREHYREPITLEDISEVAGFNPAYFSTLFKKETGERFLEYLASVRIGAARQLLTESDLSVADIAEESGYGDMKYFCKQFKKTTGLTPQEFRKLYG